MNLIRTLEHMCANHAVWNTIHYVITIRHNYSMYIVQIIFQMQLASTHVNIVSLLTYLLNSTRGTPLLCGLSLQRSVSRCRIRAKSTDEKLNCALECFLRTKKNSQQLHSISPLLLVADRNSSRDGLIVLGTFRCVSAY